MAPMKWITARSKSAMLVSFASSTELKEEECNGSAAGLPLGKFLLGSNL